jgi:hypothetical protein
MHRPSGTLGRLREVVIAAGARQIDDGPGGLGERLDEVGQALGFCFVWRHAVSLLRVLT